MTFRRFAFALCLSAAVLFSGGCSSSDSGGGGGGSGVGPPGCSKAPDCGSCQACFDACLCQSGDAQACLTQCGGGGGGAGGVAGAGGATGGGGAPSGGGGAPGGGGGGNCATFTNNPNCDPCLAASCCSQVDACNANASCTGLLACLSQNCASNPDINACAQQYCGQYSGGVTDYNAVGMCAQSSCAGKC